MLITFVSVDTALKSAICFKGGTYWMKYLCHQPTFYPFLTLQIFLNILPCVMNHPPPLKEPQNFGEKKCVH